MRDEWKNLSLKVLWFYANKTDGKFKVATCIYTYVAIVKTSLNNGVGSYSS